MKRLLSLSAVVSLFLVSTLCAAQDRYLDAGRVKLRYLEQGAGEPAVLRRYHQDPFAVAAITRSRADQAISPAAVAAVKVPTLSIVGSEDPERARLEALTKLRPTVKLLIVDGATHGGERGILRRPELIAALRDFLSAHHGATRR